MLFIRPNSKFIIFLCVYYDQHNSYLDVFSFNGASYFYCTLLVVDKRCTVPIFDREFTSVKKIRNVIFDLSLMVLLLFVIILYLLFLYPNG